VSGGPSPEVHALADLQRVPLEHGVWRPIRRPLGNCESRPSSGGQIQLLMAAREEAFEHLRTAFAEDPRTREWAASDSDLDAVRDDPGFP